MIGRRVLLGPFAILATQAWAEPPPPPGGLACLARWYGGRAELDAGGWRLAMPDGTRLVWDDGREKSFDQKLARPDLKDLFAVPYRKGPIVPVDEENDDPGRIRPEALFRAIYGDSPAHVELVSVDFLGTPLRAHRRVAPALERVAGRLKRAVAADPSLAPFFERMGGTFVWRKIQGTDRQSPHSWGIALDINVERSHYWEWAKPKRPIHWQNAIPQPIVDAFEAEGFLWAGRWQHYDTMHFEYRPELLDPTCRPSPADTPRVHRPSREDGVSPE